jgi:C1A family cysteine protease
MCFLLFFSATEILRDLSSASLSLVDVTSALLKRLTLHSPFSPYADSRPPLLSPFQPEPLIGLAQPITSTVDVDWRGVYTTPVKNQGYCGSCWAFSATEQIESDCILQTGTELILAPQQITSCDKTSFGCNGGLTERAYDYVIRAGGIENETEYPYTSGECASEERISVCAF